MNTIEKIRAEIEGHIYGKPQLTDEPAKTIAVNDICEQLLSFLDTIEKEQPSLPSDLDEAAEETLRRAHPGDAYYYVGRSARRLFKEGFKAGAEWMAGQGETRELTVERNNPWA